MYLAQRQWEILTSKSGKYILHSLEMCSGLIVNIGKLKRFIDAVETLALGEKNTVEFCWTNVILIYTVRKYFYKNLLFCMKLSKVKNVHFIACKYI